MSLRLFLQNFHPFSGAECQLIEQAFTPASFADREMLLPAHQVCQHLFFVTNGVLRIGSTNDHGIDVTHYFYKENQFCTILESFNRQISSESFIQACCDTTVLQINHKDLLALYRQLPVLDSVFQTIHQQKLVEKVNTRNLYIGASALDIYRRFLVSQPDIALRVSQKDIAEYLGITPQSLSRIRRQL